jgi:hypothetical protein
MLRVAYTYNGHVYDLWRSTASWISTITALQTPHRFATTHHIRTMLDRNHFFNRRRSHLHIRRIRNIATQRLAQQIKCKRGSHTKEFDKSLVCNRRHREATNHYTQSKTAAPV